ncbi:MAG: hypothetical protein COU11_00935 [Candidatus Harrisonbacteria bacterium CG10_big_fil_rev_8_21_14_0_10_49_15]|uniref:Uncharacterized protein n=1 Tax=Candidatus Harrisonbacteria bacterium CG10_big_fil_rev_8_21_14_0_10_49_15 TaxID=1974587 RepID=A0A2H0ULK5_9BACT|nr:MAG: hypothetical protein COU11_00935 [Candidatus Harrisonbacteria bacterium CG10_big_fil_rev_8_21_14_0_10_49_15]
MNFSVVYLIHRFFYRIWKFAYNWYAGGFLNISHVAIGLFERLDTFFAFEVTLRNITQPLYQDKTILGYILGIIFRVLRVLVGALVYVLLSLLTIAVYLFWAFLPILITIEGFGLGLV